MYEAYSHEVSSAGWWPTSPEVGPAYYSYMYPQPAGFDRATVQPDPARYDTAYGEFLVREDDLRREADPERAVMSFLQSTYDAGATLAAWDRGALERAGRPPVGGGGPDRPADPPERPSLRGVPAARGRLVPPPPF